jgi:hypothetical protein
MAIASRKPLLVNVAWTIALFCVVTSGYVLSYAPVVRVIKAAQPDDLDRLYAADGYELPPYAPIDWMIDQTPLRNPLLRWAELCGVGTDFLFASEIRSGTSFHIVDP